MLQPLYGLELTFLPRKHWPRWPEFRRKREAQAAAAALNQEMAKDVRIRSLASDIEHPVRGLFKARADTFRATWLGQPHASWCIEMGNVPLPAHHIYNDAFEGIYESAAALDLVPHVERDRRGVIQDYPTGGGHIHVGTDFWHEGSHYLVYLYLLERALTISYANNPWMRWLYAQWSDNRNSRVAIDPSSLRAMDELRRKRRFTARNASDVAHSAALSSDNSAIRQRIARSHGGKSSLSTYELRWFDMPRTAGELRLQVSFVDRWFRHYGEQLDAIAALKGKERDEAMTAWYRNERFTLTTYQYRRLTTDLTYARETAAAYLTEIGMDPEPTLDTFWERNYVRRMRHGTFA